MRLRLMLLLRIMIAVSLLAGCSPGGGDSSSSKARRTDTPRAWTYVPGNPSESELQPGVSLEELGSVDAAGAPGPAEAARRYLVSIASGDERRFEEVTGHSVSEGEMLRLRQGLFDQTSRVEVANVFNLDLIAQDGDSLLYHLIVSLASDDFVGADVRVLRANDGKYGVLDARPWALANRDRERAVAEVKRRKEIEAIRHD